MKTLPSICPMSSAIVAGLLALSLPAAAQSAEGFDTSDLTPAQPAPAAAAPAKAAPAPTPAAAVIGPSRYAGDEIEAYVNTLSARLFISKRETDPFGRYQDPDRKAPEPKVLAKGPNQRTFKPEPATPFADVVAGITVKLVIPGKQQFLIDGNDRVFKIKDILSLLLPSGKQVKVQVTSVTSTRIGFRNTETNEAAVLSLNMRPAGMSKGGDVATPGFQPVGTDAPIQIQPVMPFSNNP
jgi:hypothetical protein